MFHNQLIRQRRAHIGDSRNVSRILAYITHEYGFSTLCRDPCDPFPNLDTNAIRYFVQVSDTEAKVEFLGLFVHQENAKNLVINDLPTRLVHPPHSGLNSSR